MKSKSSPVIGCLGVLLASGSAVTAQEDETCFDVFRHDLLECSTAFGPGSPSDSTTLFVLCTIGAGIQFLDCIGSSSAITQEAFSATPRMALDTLGAKAPILPPVRVSDGSRTLRASVDPDRPFGNDITVTVTLYPFQNSVAWQPITLGIDDTPADGVVVAFEALDVLVPEYVNGLLIAEARDANQQLVGVSMAIMNMHARSDVNSDGEVDVDDVVHVASRVGMADPLADINRDGIVDMSDVAETVGAVGSADPWQALGSYKKMKQAPVHELIRLISLGDAAHPPND